MARNQTGREVRVRDTSAAPEPTVSVKAAAAFLGVSRSLVYAWVERKQVPHYRLGRSIRFRLSELDEWLKRFHDGGPELCQ